MALCAQGQLLSHGLFYFHQPEILAQGKVVIVSLLAEICATQAIAIGNGTAGREALEVIKNMQILHETLPLLLLGG